MQGELQEEGSCPRGFMHCLAHQGPRGAGPETRARECHAPAASSLGSIEDVAVIVETEQMLGEVMGLQKLSSSRDRLQMPGFNSEAHKPAEIRTETR